MACADNCGGDIPIVRPSLTRSPQVRASALAWLFIACGLTARWVEAPLTLQIGAFAAAILAGAFYFAREALEELWEERKIGIELLMTLAIGAAAALGNWREGALVAGLYSITEALEGFTIQRTRYAIRGLMDLIPPKARLLKDGREIEIDVEAIRVGDRFVVRPGEAIPTDGVIREGSSALHQAAVTGESLPVERGVGDTAFAGTLERQFLRLIGRHTGKSQRDQLHAWITDLVATNIEITDSRNQL